VALLEIKVFLYYKFRPGKYLKQPTKFNLLKNIYKYGTNGSQHFSVHTSGGTKMMQQTPLTSIRCQAYSKTEIEKMICVHKATDVAPKVKIFLKDQIKLFEKQKMCGISELTQIQPFHQPKSFLSEPVEKIPSASVKRKI